DDAGDPADGPVQVAADHRADGQGDEGGPGEVHRGRGVGLHRQAGEHRPTALAAAGLAVPLGRPGEGRTLTSDDVEAIEIRLLLDGVFHRYGFDFRDYAFPSVRRRVLACVQA